jgi:ERF superfamily
MAKNEVKSLRAKLVEIAHGLGTVEKSKRNPHFGYNYVGEGQLWAKLGPKMAEQNIMFSTSVLTAEPNYGEGKAGVFVMVTVECTFYDCDSNESLIVRGAGMGWDSSDKAVYKAITGAVKYVLMKNFWVTDEQDPEAGEQTPGAAAAAPSGHRPTREYEREGEREETKGGKQITDLMQLSTWMLDHKVPESFVLAMLVEKKLIGPTTKKLGNVQPGILRRVLNPSSLERLKKAWDESKVPSDDGKKEVRTREGDQTRETQLRTFCKAEDISADDYLEQEGVRDWRQVKVPSGKNKGTPLGKLAVGSLRWYLENWQPEYRGKITDVAALFDAALCLASAELMQAEMDQGGGYL